MSSCFFGARILCTANLLVHVSVAYGNRTVRFDISLVWLIFKFLPGLVCCRRFY